MATRHCFGIKADVKDNICYIDETTVIYPSGHNVVIFSTEQKTQKFIPGTENTEGITAMAVSPNKKYVAVAERAKEGEKALVTIFDLHTLKRRKVRRARIGALINEQLVGSKAPAGGRRAERAEEPSLLIGLRITLRSATQSEQGKGARTVAERPNWSAKLR